MKVVAFKEVGKGRPPPTEEAIKQSRKQSRRSADPKILLMDVLVNGPVPATIVEERGAVHGFTNLGGDIERYSKSIAIDANDVDPNDIDTKPRGLLGSGRPPVTTTLALPIA